MRQLKTTLLTLILLCGGLTFAQDPASKLVQFHMAILRYGPKWTSSPGVDAEEVYKKHRAYVHSLLDSGKVAIAGPIKKDDSDVAGVYIFRVKSPEEALSLVMADPLVAAGHVVPEMHPWWAEDVMKKPSGTSNLMTAYLAFLKRGDKWTPEQTPATEELQKAHLANIMRLAEMKKLVVAGPFGDNGNLRGIFVFKVGSLAEAQELAATDPAVKAGRLALEFHTWMVPEGVLP